MRRLPWFQIDESSFVADTVVVKRGRSTKMCWGCYFGGWVSIGEGCLIGPMVIVTSFSHAVVDTRQLKTQKCTNKQVIIGDHVYIGAGAKIFGGSIIGNGAVIGAGSVVVEDSVIGENELWVGNPCRFKKKRIPYKLPEIV